MKANYTLVKMQSREKADCAVLAAQFCLGLTYEAAYSLVESAGRKPKQRFISGNFTKLWLTPRPELTHVTIQSALENMQTGRFIVFVAGHFFAVVDGRIFDNNFTNPRKRVKMIFEAPLDNPKFLERYPNLAHLVALDKLPDMRGINCR